MKKIVIISIGLGLFLLLTSEKNLKLCKKMVGCKTNSQEVQIDEYFSKLSQYYYGTPSYNKELSLVNNSAPNLSEDELIIPSIEAINKLKNEQTVSNTNDINYVQQINANLYKIDYKKNFKKSSIFPKPIAVVLISIIFILISFYVRRKKGVNVF